LRRLGYSQQIVSANPAGGRAAFPTWHRETSVTVPAGTFTDCWTANQQVSYAAYLTYCRGAGLVRSYSKDLAGDGWDAQLSSKSF